MIYNLATYNLPAAELTPGSARASHCMRGLGRGSDNPQVAEPEAWCLVPPAWPVTVAVRRSTMTVTKERSTMTVTKEPDSAQAGSHRRVRAHGGPELGPLPACAGRAPGSWLKPSRCPDSACHQRISSAADNPSTFPIEYIKLRRIITPVVSSFRTRNSRSNYNALNFLNQTSL